MDEKREYAKKHLLKHMQEAGLPRERTLVEPHPMKDDNDHLSCRFCEWVGQRGEASEERVVSDEEAWRALAGRDGWVWRCPSCKMQIDQEWRRMS